MAAAGYDECKVWTIKEMNDDNDALFIILNRFFSSIKINSVCLQVFPLSSTCFLKLLKSLSQLNKLKLSSIKTTGPKSIIRCERP